MPSSCECRTLLPNFVKTAQSVASRCRVPKLTQINEVPPVFIILHVKFESDLPITSFVFRAHKISWGECPSSPWPLSRWQKINGVPPLIINMKFKSAWAKTKAFIVWMTYRHTLSTPYERPHYYISSNAVVRRQKVGGDGMTTALQTSVLMK